MRLPIAALHLALLATPAAPAAETSPAISPSQLQDLFKRCAPTVAPETMHAIVRVESAANPYAIGVVDGHLERQPRNLEEAAATAEALERAGRNFSVGIAQVNRYNLPRFGLTYRTAFEPCGNLRAGSKLLEECYLRAVAARLPDALAAAVSCYYSGTFDRGFHPDPDGQPSYVGLVLKRSDPAPSTPAPPPPAPEPAQEKPSVLLRARRDTSSAAPAEAEPPQAVSPVVF